MNPFAVRRNGFPIHQVGLKNPGKNAGITYSRSFMEWEACHGAGLDLWKWDQGLYPVGFRARVLAFWELHLLCEAHRQDANYVKPKGRK